MLQCAKSVLSGNAAAKICLIDKPQKAHNAHNSPHCGWLKIQMHLKAKHFQTGAVMSTHYLIMINNFSLLKCEDLLPFSYCCKYI